MIKVFRLQVTPNPGWDLQLEYPESLSGNKTFKASWLSFFFFFLFPTSLLFPRIMQNESLQMMAKKTEVMGLSQEVTDREEKKRKEEGGEYKD